jgi:hypothetical protein
MVLWARDQPGINTHTHGKMATLHKGAKLTYVVSTMIRISHLLGLSTPFAVDTPWVVSKEHARIINRMAARCVRMYQPTVTRSKITITLIGALWNVVFGIAVEPVWSDNRRLYLFREIPRTTEATLRQCTVTLNSYTQAGSSRPA